VCVFVCLCVVERLVVRARARLLCWDNIVRFPEMYMDRNRWLSGLARWAADGGGPGCIHDFFFFFF
jgi:hypothetical protein